MAAGLPLILLVPPIVALTAYVGYRSLFHPIVLYSFSIFFPLALTQGLIETAGIKGAGHVFNSQVFAAALQVASIGTFSIPWLISALLFRRRPKLQPQPYEHAYIADEIALTSGFLAASIAIVVWWIGYLPMLSAVLGRFDVGAYNVQLRALPLGLLALILVTSILLLLWSSSILVYAKYYRQRLGKIAWYALWGFVLFVCVWQTKRQLLLFLVFTLALMYEHRHRNMGGFARKRTSPTTLLLVGGVLVALIFTSIQLIRVQQPIGGVFSLLYYGAWPALNFQSLVGNLGHIEVAPHSVPFVLSQIVPRRFGGAEAKLLVGGIVFEPSSPSGYLAPWLLDFGGPGVLVGSFVLGLVSYSAWRRVEIPGNVSASHLRIHALVQWCVATAGIYAHLLSTVFFWLPLLVLAIERVLLFPVYGRERLRQARLSAAANRDGAVRMGSGSRQN